MDAFTSSGNYLGTERLGRPLTSAENVQLGKLLREHDFVGASLVALRFAYRRTGNRERARDLIGRVNLRLVRWGWDPNAVTLVSCLCRLVYSEHSHEKSETAATRRAEAAFLREQGIHEAVLPSAPRHGDPEHSVKERAIPSAEQQVIRLQEDRTEVAQEEKRLAEMRTDMGRLREELRGKKDDAGVLYLDMWVKGTESAAKMAEESGRDVTEFYAATKRMKRVVARIVAERQGAQTDDEESE